MEETYVINNPEKKHRKNKLLRGDLDSPQTSIENFRSERQIKNSNKRETSRKINVPDIKNELEN